MDKSRFEYLIDRVIHSPRFQEPARLLRIDAGCSRFTVHFSGTVSEKHYDLLLTAEELDALSRQLAPTRKLDGAALPFYLATECWRIRLAYLHDPLLALGVSRVDALPHQLEAVYEHMLRQPSLRFMLADDPGAGKTIMAGLLLKELKLRGVIDRTLIVAPSPLRTQWQREMREKFNERFDVVERAILQADGMERGWNLRNQVVASMDFVKQPDVLDSLAGADRWDLIIVDEAHKMTAYRRGSGGVDRSQRYRLGEVLSERADRFLLMTATPHKGDPENFQLLLSLIDPDLFANPEILQRAVERRENPVFLRRLKEHMRRFDGKPLFPGRQAITVAFELRDQELALYERVTNYVENNYNRALSDENRNVTFALIVLQRRLASSVRAVRRSLQNRRRRLLDLRDEVNRDPKRLLKLKRELHDDRDDDSLREDERWRLEEEALRFTVARDMDELDAELAQIDELIDLARRVEEQQPERKLDELRAVMRKLQRDNKNEKLLIFTEARDTLAYLLENMHAWGIATASIHGGMSPQQRIQAEARFREADVPVMVATEAAGEGINLQFCHLMINYDIPWNPTRLEQRLGRIHRYGQDREVFMVNLVAGNTREGRVLEAVFNKLERMRQEMGGDRVYDVIGERLADANLQDMIRDAITRRRHFSDILDSLDSAMPAASQAALEAASISALATADIDIAGMRERSQRARERRLSPAHIRAFFRDAFDALFPGRLSQRADGFWRINYLPAALRDLPADLARRYEKPARDYLRFTFDVERARASGVEAVGPGHPLFESLLAHALDKCGVDLERGAVFIDHDDRDGLIWLLTGAIEDGLGNIAGQKLVAIYQPAKGGELQNLPPGIFVDLGIPDSPIQPSETARALIDDSSAAMAYCIEQVMAPYQTEILNRRRRESAIVRRYLRESFEILIVQSEGKLMDYDERQSRGHDMRNQIRDEERQLDDLKRRRDNRLQRAQNEAAISMKTPRILGVAALVPASQAGDFDAMRRDRDIELTAMRIAMQYERDHGRTPHDRSADNLGFDILSGGEEGERFIEVKGRAGVGKVELTENEWRTAENLGDAYWLYIVSDIATEPQLETVQDPVNSFADSIIKRTRYEIPAPAWKK